MTIHAVQSLPLEQVGQPEPVDPPRPIWVDAVQFEHVGTLRVKAFAVAQSESAVFVEIAWQGRLQRAWVPRDTVTRPALQPRDR